jgi:DNA-binding ferritin-like protein
MSPYQILQSICSELKTARDVEDKITADNLTLLIKLTEEAVWSFTKLQQLMDNTIY